MAAAKSTRSAAWGKKSSTIFDGIRQAFRYECIKEEVIESYLEQAGPVVYGKAYDSGLIFSVSELKRSLPWHEESFDGNTM